VARVDDEFDVARDEAGETGKGDVSIRDGVI
jgi:hypothetical protein